MTTRIFGRELHVEHWWHEDAWWQCNIGFSQGDWLFLLNLGIYKWQLQIYWEW